MFHPSREYYLKHFLIPQALELIRSFLCRVELEADFVDRGKGLLPEHDLVEVLSFFTLVPFRDEYLIGHNVPGIHQPPLIEQLLLVQVVLDNLLLLILWIVPSLMYVLEYL